ncbi:MAG: HAD-IA family hydrolase [Lachnospiraceae bacterium]|mgnify:FL=1
MQKYNTIIFDLDGTLLNTLEDLADSVNYCMRKFSCPERTLEEVRQFVGNGIRKLMERAVPMGTENPEFENIFETFKSYYTEHCQIKTRAYPEIEELLSKLAENKCKMAIVSNKNIDAVKELNRLYFYNYIKLAVGEQQGVRKKPFPDSVNHVIGELEADKKHVLYVGDSEVDKATADNAGVDCALVSWGFREKDMLLELKPLAVIDKPLELLQFV